MKSDLKTEEQNKDSLRLKVLWVEIIVEGYFYLKVLSIVLIND